MSFDHFFGIYGSDNILVPYGSQVYGTRSDKSDYDYIAIGSDLLTGEEYLHDNINIHLYSFSDFSSQLADHKIHALEAYYLHNGIVKDYFPFTLDLVKLRHSLSDKASHSFVKANKKIDKEKDYYIGWKSLFHSLRILNFGAQIAGYRRIENYGEANHYWYEILNAQQYNWPYFKQKYQPEYNRLASEFRKLAPKE